MSFNPPKNVFVFGAVPQPQQQQQQQPQQQPESEEVDKFHQITDGYKNNIIFKYRNSSLPPASVMSTATLEELRYLVFGFGGDPKERVHQMLTQRYVLSDALVGEILRFIELTNNYDLLPLMEYLQSPRMLLFALNTKPSSAVKNLVSELSKADADDPGLLEIWYKIFSIDWFELGLDKEWESFFKCFIGSFVHLLPLLLDSLLTAPQLTVEQVGEIVDHSSVEMLVTVWYWLLNRFNAEREEAEGHDRKKKKKGKKDKKDKKKKKENEKEKETDEKKKKKKNKKDKKKEKKKKTKEEDSSDDSSQIGQKRKREKHPEKEREAKEAAKKERKEEKPLSEEAKRLAQVVARIAIQLFQLRRIGSDALTLIKEIAASPLVVPVLSQVMPYVHRRHKLYHVFCEYVGKNPRIDESEAVSHYFVNVPLIMGIARRKHLKRETITLLLTYEQMVPGGDSVTININENAVKEYRFTEEEIETLIKDEGMISSEAALKFCFHPSLTPRLMAMFMENPMLTYYMAQRTDLPENLREILLGESDVTLAAKVMVGEGRMRVQREVYEQHKTKPQFLAALAQNPALDPELKVKLLQYNGEKAFLVHRELALRPDLSEEEILQLLNSRDLDVYINLTRNKKIFMTSEIMERLMKFANVSEKEQEEWIPSLTLQYINFNRSSLANRLWEYQVQCQINLLDRVDEDQKIEWLSLNEPNLTSAIVESTHNPSYEFLNAVIEHTPPAFFVDTVMRVLRHMDFLNLDTLIEIVKKGGAEIARAVAPCLPKQSSSSASSSASAMSSSNATLSTTISQVLYTKEMQRILDNSDLFKEPLYTVSLMRALFEANRQRSDVAAFLLEALKDVLRHKEYRTGSETSSLKSITDQLLLDLCREHEFSVTAFDELITLLSSQLLCELHVYAKLGPNTTWTFLIGCLSATWGTEFQAMESEVLKQLAARSNLPTSAQWTLALHHSKVGNYREGNDLFHLMVSNGVKLDDAIIHYFLMNEPSYIQMCLQAGLLNALQTQFVVEKILPTLAKEGELPEVETYFQNFIQTVQQFTGSDIKMEDIEWGKISSETINRSITYMTAGLELRDIPNFLKDDLHLNVAFLTKVVDALSKGVRILEAPARRRSTQDRFRFGNVDNKQAMDRLQGAKGGNDGAERDAPELQLSVPITSLQLAIDHFPDLVLSFDIQHYLPEFLEQNLLVYTPRETSVEVTLLKANDELKELFPAQFLSTLNLKVKSFLSMRFSVLIEKRKKDFTKAEFIKILKEDSSELEAIHKIFANLEASADNVEEEIEEEVEQELLRKEAEERQKAEEEKVKEGESGKGKDLISPEEAERKKREAEEREAEYQRRKVWAPRPEDTYTHNARLVETLVQNGLAKAKVKDLQWMLNELIAIIKGHLRIRVMPTAQSLKQALIKFYSPTEVITTTLKNVEYIYAYRFWKLFPDLAQKSYPENIKELFLLWGPPEVFEKSTCGVIQQKIQFLLDLLDLGKKAEKEGSKPEDLSAFLQAIVSALRSDKENFILENGKLYYTCTIKPTSQDDEEDSVIHSCCMNTIEKVTLAVLSKVGKLACATIRSLSSLVAPDSNTTIVSGFSFSATVKPEAEMKQMKILKLEELEGLSNSLSTQEVKKEDATLLDLYNYLLPYQNIININDFAYTDLLSKSHSLGGHTVFSLGKVFSLEELRGFPLKELLPNLELVHYYVEEIQPQFLDRQSSIVTVENKPTDYFFNGTKIDDYCFYDDRKWREIITRLKQQFVDEHTNMLKQSLSRFHIHYVSGPDSSSTEETTEYGVEPIPGAQLAQHPMILDEDGMVTFTPEGEIARDTSKSKVIQPVYKVVVQKKHIPKLTEYDTKLDLNGGCLLPATHIRLLHASCEEYFDQLKKTLAIKFNSLSKAHMEKLIKQFESGVENGLTITIPSGTAGPGFTYTLYPIEAECEKDIEALKTKMENLGKDKLQCIKNFTISHRDTIAAELALYLSFVRDSILKDEHKFSRYCQAALCVLALQDDVNYHVMLDEANTHAIRYISDILIKLGERLFEYEEQNKAGLGATTILVMFPCHVQHVGILFVSSHYNQENGQWERFIHYNPNACAAEEYNRLAGFAPPKQLEHGVKLETIFNTGNDHNVLLTFEKHVIETTRREMDEKARDAIRRNDYHDESGLGVAKNLAHIVWTEKSGINHIKCEAAFVTASPKIPLTTRKGSLAMDVGPEEVDEMIRTLEDITLRHK